MSSPGILATPVAMPVGAVLVACEGAPPLAPLVGELRRDVLDVSIASAAVFEGAAELERAVVVVCVGDVEPPGLFERAVAWAERRMPRPGLLACATSTDRALSERALAAGFDDAVVGPLSAREIAARIRALHRRVHWTGRPRAGRVRFGAITLDTDGHELWIDGATVPLTTTELSVVRTLMRAQGRALTRAELLDAAWGAGNFEVSERAVDNVILRLRRKLPRPDAIQTVRGVGFRMSDD